jgi:hypothetical protein
VVAGGGGGGGAELLLVLTGGGTGFGTPSSFRVEGGRLRVWFSKMRLAAHCSMELEGEYGLSPSLAVMPLPLAAMPGFVAAMPLSATAAESIVNC